MNVPTNFIFAHNKMLVVAVILLCLIQYIVADQSALFDQKQGEHCWFPCTKVGAPCWVSSCQKDKPPNGKVYPNGSLKRFA